MAGKPHQFIPASRREREALREKGQFWTPDRVAEAMVAYALGGGAKTIFDPAVSFSLLGQPGAYGTNL